MSVPLTANNMHEKVTPISQSLSSGYEYLWGACGRLTSKV